MENVNFEPTTTSIQNIDFNELDVSVKTSTPSIAYENLSNSIHRIFSTTVEVGNDKLPIINTTPGIYERINSTEDIFKYIKGTVYDNIHQLWRSKLFEQKLASTRISVQTEPTTTSTISTLVKNVVTSSPIATTSIVETSTKYNLKNYSSAFSLTYNLMKSNQNKNLTSNLKGVNRLVQAVNSFDIFNESTTSNIHNNNHSLSSHRQTYRYNVPEINSVPVTCNCNKTMASSFFDEYTNVWKLSFFVLAFVIGFVSLFLLLSLIFKVLMSVIYITEIKVKFC